MNFLNLKKQNKYIVRYCVKEGNTYNFIKNVGIKANTKKIKYDKDNEFTVDIENPTYKINNKSYFCIDVNSKQIYFEQLKESDFISSRINKMIMSDEIILQLAKASTQPINQPFSWTNLIIGLIIGSLIGFIIKIFVPI